MIKQFSDTKSFNIVFMFKYMFCNTQNLILTDQCEIVRLMFCLQGLPVYSFSFWMTDMEKNTLTWIDWAIIALTLIKFSFTKCYYPKRTAWWVGNFVRNAPLFVR